MLVIGVFSFLFAHHPAWPAPKTEPHSKISPFGKPERYGKIPGVSPFAERYGQVSHSAPQIVEIASARERRKSFEEELDKKLREKQTEPEPVKEEVPDQDDPQETLSIRQKTLVEQLEGSPFPTLISSGNSKMKDREVRSGFIWGHTFSKKPVTYTEYDGMAMFEGDIVLGTVEELEQEKEPVAQQSPSEPHDSEQLGLAISDVRYRWPHGIVPYTIQEGISPELRGRVFEAIEHWHESTNIHLMERSDQENYVTFREAEPGTHCSSRIGMNGGQQFINLEPRCNTGSIIHEIGHAVGLWHEQSREDRDNYITIVWDNIEAQFHHNFNQHITDGDDIGPYDYESIMHYHAWAFALDRKRPTIQAPQPIGQREKLSEGDILTVNEMYAE